MHVHAERSLSYILSISINVDNVDAYINALNYCVFLDCVCMLFATAEVADETVSASSCRHYRQHMYLSICHCSSHDLCFVAYSCRLSNSSETWVTFSGRSFRISTISPTGFYIERSGMECNSRREVWGTELGSSRARGVHVQRLRAPVGVKPPEDVGIV